MSEQTTILLSAAPAHRIPVNEVIAWMLTRFPGLQIVSENSFEAERQRYKEKAAALREDPEALAGLDLVIRSSLAKELRSGPGKDVFVPIGVNGWIKGKVWGSSVLLWTTLPIDHPHIVELRDFLRALDVGALSVYQQGDENDGDT